jgi:DNA-directed RNA polymerase omega subunit
MIKLQQSRGKDLDMDKIVELSGGNRFNLVIMAAARAREIRHNNSHSTRYEHIHPNITALKEFESGKLGPNYIKRIR